MRQRAHRLAVRLTATYGGMAAIGAALTVAAVLPAGQLPAVADLAEEARRGFAATLLAPCLMALSGLAGTVWLTAARQRPAFAGAGFAARSGQAAALPAGAALTALACWLFWPLPGLGVAPLAVAPQTATALAGLAFGFAFVSLVAERFLAAGVGPSFAEAASLRRLLLLATALLALAGGVEAARGAGLIWAGWVAAVACLVPVLVTAELALRAAARLFLPAPAPERATAATGSLVAALLTGGPRMPGALIRSHLGLDFARNWALGFLVAAAAPALFLTCLLCWGLSGLKLVGQDHRGVYERLGAPVAVLGPGLHLLLPWPLGRLRPVELGTIHTIAAGSDAAPEASDGIAADAVPPASAARLWTTPHATEVNYLVASQGGTLQNFQVVSTEILVLYRTGLADQDALQATYGVASQDAVVRDAAARLATRYFGRRTLDEVLGDQPQTLSEALRQALAADVAGAHAGVEILSVAVEEIHPPAGAASAYHQVQAAEIDATASVANETGRATQMQAVAQREAHQMTTVAQARAAETSSTANAAAYRFGADRRAYAASPGSFLLERSLLDVGKALAQTPLTLVDHRLPDAQAPTFDLRALGGGDLTGVAAGSPAVPGRAAASAQPATPFPAP